MSSYRELIAKARELDDQILRAREAEAAIVLEEIKARVAEFGFTAADVFSSRKKRTQRTRSGPSYRDPVSGSTWSGMGRAPRWINGQDRTPFQINDE